ncbi:restriction endonuclease subunit S [Shimia thalassica]|uniref:restriction endonuclease subunit S n=1 Tax=Shimia thalassica TaxID=1715693 RepID=UPI00273260DB|nr:restriction endonuclease subunit S [Shimia thalassica]MDP2581333.1 restriction endonuclease subunit S [Shimia thalassica]
MNAAHFVPFLEVCDIQGGTQPPKSTFVEEPAEGYVRLLQIQDFKTDKKAVYIPDKKTLKKCISKDILIARYGASLGKILSGLEGAYNVALVKTIPDLERIDRSYLAHYLRSDAFQSFILNLGGRAAQAGFNKADLERIEIPLPPLEEQKRIAGILDQADTLRRLRTRALDKLNTLGQAIFHEMFGNVVSNSKNLLKARVGDHCDRVSVGVVVKPASYYQDQGIPAVRGTNIKPTGINLDDVVYFSKEDGDGPLRKSRINEGDVLAVRSGRPGLAAVVPPELDGANCIDVLIATTRSETLLPEFLRDFLNSSDGRRLVLSNSVGQVQQHFNVKSLAGAEIPLPEIALQKLYLERMNELEMQRQKLLEGSLKQSSLFASLQHRAFRGEL